MLDTYSYRKWLQTNAQWNLNLFKGRLFIIILSSQAYLRMILYSSLQNKNQIEIKLTWRHRTVNFIFTINAVFFKVTSPSCRDTPWLGCTFKAVSASGSLERVHNGNKCIYDVCKFLHDAFRVCYLLYLVKRNLRLVINWLHTYTQYHPLWKNYMMFTPYECLYSVHKPTTVSFVICIPWWKKECYSLFTLVSPFINIRKNQFILKYRQNKNLNAEVRSGLNFFTP